MACRGDVGGDAADRLDRLAGEREVGPVAIRPVGLALRQLGRQTALVEDDGGVIYESIISPGEEPGLEECAPPASSDESYYSESGSGDSPDVDSDAIDLEGDLVIRQRNDAAARKLVGHDRHTSHRLGLMPGATVAMSGGRLPT